MTSQEEDESSNYDAVLVKQCQLKRTRFMFQGHDAHSIQNFGGKTVAPMSSRTQVKQQEETEIESIHSGQVAVQQIPANRTTKKYNVESKVKLRIKQNRPKMNLEQSMHHDSKVQLQSLI